jgi:flagellar biosynthetic protein FliQ
MGPEFAVWLIKQTIFTALAVAAPMLLTGLVVGISISLFQAVTSVQEMTLTFIPKILAVAVVMLYTMPWMIKMVGSFARELFTFVSAGNF